MKLFLILILSTLLLISCAKQLERGMNVKDIQLETDDEKKIAGTFYEGGSEGIILLHQLDRNRNDWKDFAAKLQNSNYSVLAIDLRGHGQSDGSWKDFSDDDFAGMVLDVEATVQYLKQNKIINITIIGASIGANIALNYAAEHEEIKKIVLLSPGLNYHGVETEDIANVYNGKILIVASRDDRYSFDSSNRIFNATKTKDKQIKIYDKSGHGMKMFEGTDLNSVIINWLKS